MHISFYKRPLFIALVIYALFLALFLKVPAPPEKLTFAENAKVEALIISYPENKKQGKTFEIEISGVNENRAQIKAYAKCGGDICGNLTRGQKIIFRGAIFPVDNAHNFGSFDQRKFLARKKIFTQAEIYEIEKTEAYSYFWITISKIRMSLLNTFEKNFDGPLLPILSGITIGEKSSLERELYTAFQDSGAMHLLVASGGNVGFVTLIVYFLCSVFGAGRKTSAASALLLGALYTFVAGADAPLLRAYTMTLAATVGFVLGRKSGVLQGFIIAAFLILLYNPQSLFEASFQMSFLATLAIILLSSNFNFNFKMPRIFNFIIQLFFVSLAAQLALLPVFTNYFYKISFTAAISNIILVPLSGVIMAGGFIIWLLSFIPYVDFLFQIPVFALKFLLIIFKFLVEFFADFTISKIVVSALKPTSIAAYYAGLFALLNITIIKRKIRYSLFWTMLAILLSFCGIFTKRNAVYVLEGRYNKTLLIKENNKIKIIGAGIYGEILRKAVLASGSKNIECLFLNNAGKSGSYGLSDLAGLKIKNIYMPYGDIADETKRRLTDIGAKNIFMWPQETYCGVTAENPWYKDEKGSVYAKSNSTGSLSYAYKNLRTAGDMKEVEGWQKIM
ncbi:MAG: ComEC family competence protein [Elusimicrobiota bacterium]|jgi:competence protein ComEC|nr:ComEC family competence protein [Elusimicrobiota bacterium]